MWVFARVRWRQTLERIGNPYAAVGHAIRLEDGTHKDGGPSAPHASFDEIAGNSVGDYFLDTEFQIIKAFKANHRVRNARPNAAFHAVCCVQGQELAMTVTKGWPLPHLLRLGIDQVHKAPLH